MDLYHGSTPLSFISFRLENLLEKNVPAPSTSQANISATSEGSASESKGLLPENTCGLISQAQESTERGSHSKSQGSSIDVTIYAESVVQPMERQQAPASQQEDIPYTDLNQDGSLNADAVAKTSTDPKIRRLSTPILSEEVEDAREADFPALELALRVIITSESQLPELPEETEPELVNVSDAPSRTDDENVSSVCDAQLCPEEPPESSFQQDREKKKKRLRSLVKLILLPCTASILSMLGQGPKVEMR